MSAAAAAPVGGPPSSGGSSATSAGAGASAGTGVISSAAVSADEVASYLFKLLLIGDSGCGKTALMVRYCDAMYDAGSLRATLSVDFKIKTIRVQQHLCKLQIWDTGNDTSRRTAPRAQPLALASSIPSPLQRPCLTSDLSAVLCCAVSCPLLATAGQERFRTITAQYYRGAHGLFVVFDLTSPDSFAHVPAWLDEAERHAPAGPGAPPLSKILIGNKADLLAERKVEQKAAEDFAKARGLRYIETSAKGLVQPLPLCTLN
jgi:Ras-related protein Rab-1A